MFCIRVKDLPHTITNLSLQIFRIPFFYARADFERICTPQSYEGIPAVWKSSENVRVISKIRWSIVIYRMKKKRTELYLLRAASFGMVGASVDGKRSVIVTERERERERWKQALSVRATTPTVGRQPFPAWYRKWASQWMTEYIHRCAREREGKRRRFVNVLFLLLLYPSFSCPSLFSLNIIYRYVVLIILDTLNNFFKNDDSSMSINTSI